MYKKIKFDKRQIIEFGLWSVVTATFLLPNMLDRYLFLGDILSIVYYIYNRDKIYIPIGINLVSFYTYSMFLFKPNVIPIQYVSILNLVIVVLLTKDLWDKYFRENNSTIERDKKDAERVFEKD